MLVCNVVGARPNFMKIAPVVLELNRRSIPQLLVHTGQHYDPGMSSVFFEELGLPEPDVYLGVGSDTSSRQTARIMWEFAEVCGRYRPSLVIVGGDVNSTVSAALTASQHRIPVGHVEAGLRSFDRDMPEETNRIVTDHLSALLFTTEPSANQNLCREGIPEPLIHFVGNCMVDTLMMHLDRAVQREPWRDFGCSPDSYALLTLHRPANVDCTETLGRLMALIGRISRDLPVLFPVHPRTRERLGEFGIAVSPDIHLCDPLPYLTFIGLAARAKFVLTDSGGIQEETTALGVPCLTLRWNTERPVTVRDGTNSLVGTDPDRIQGAVKEILNGNGPKGAHPPLWDGHAGFRIVNVIESWLREHRG